MTYPEEKKKILAAIDAQEPLFIDANVFVDAAELGDLLLLQKLVLYPKFLPTLKNLNELYGLTTFGRLSPATSLILRRFMNDVKGRAVRPSAADVAEIKQELQPLVHLLPRSVANHVSIAFIDTLIRWYTEAKTRPITDDVIIVMKRRRAEEEKRLRSYCEERYLSLIDALHIDESKLNENTYFADIDKFVRAVINDINNALDPDRLPEAIIKPEAFIKLPPAERAAMLYDRVISALNAFRRKTCNADVQFAAEVLSRGATAFSSDSDVKWMFTFYAIRAA